MNTIIKILTLSFVLSALSGCTWLEDWSPRERNKEFSTSAPSPDEKMKVVKSAGGTWLESKKKETLDAQPRIFSTAQKQEKPVFADSLDGGGTIEQRIAELENAINNVQSTLEKMLPALTRLAEIDRSLEAGLANIKPAAGALPTVEKQLRNVTKNKMKQAPFVNKTRVVPVSTRAQQGLVHRLRIGEHSTKTRLVLDTSNKIDFSYSVDNQALVMNIDLPAGGWSTKDYIEFSRSPLISSFTATDNSTGGTSLNIKLKMPVSILWADNLVPTGSNGHRIVIDLSRL